MIGELQGALDNVVSVVAVHEHRPERAALGAPPAEGRSGVSPAHSVRKRGLSESDRWLLPLEEAAASVAGTRGVTSHSGPLVYSPI